MPASWGETMRSAAPIARYPVVRLNFKDIKARPGDPAFFKRPEQHILLDHLPAGYINQIGCRLHHSQLLFASYPCGFRGQRYCQNNEIAFP